ERQVEPTLALDRDALDEVSLDRMLDDGAHFLFGAYFLGAIEPFDNRADARPRGIHHRARSDTHGAAANADVARMRAAQLPQYAALMRGILVEHVDVRADQP